MRREAAPSRLFRFALPVLLMLVAGPAAGAEPETRYDTSRIVSIGGSVTEILYTLDVAQKIVAVDTTSVWPATALKEKPNVGYMRQLSAEGVLGLSPTLVLAVEGAGPKETIDVLGRAGVSFVTVPDKFTGEGIIEKIGAIATIVGAQAHGKCLAATVGDDLAALSAIRSQIHRPVRVAFVLSLANDRPMMSGRGTAADGIIAMAGAANAFSDFEGYKAVSAEAVVAAKPDAVLVMQRGEHSLSADTVFASPGFAMTPAAEHKNFVAMEGLYLLGFGPRTARAARDLAARLYPDVKAGTLPSEQRPGAASCER